MRTGVWPSVLEAESDSLHEDAEKGPPATVHKGNQKRTTTTTPTRVHIVSKHFPTDPTCDMCKMTKATRDRCKDRPESRADGLPPPLVFGDMLNMSPKPRVAFSSVCLCRSKLRGSTGAILWNS